MFLRFKVVKVLGQSKLTANDMDDETVKNCLDSELEPMNALAQVIPSSGHRIKFITAFRKQFIGNGATDQVKLGRRFGSEINVKLNTTISDYLQLTDFLGVVPE